MARKRPAAVLVIAIFHFIFAACGGISGIWTVAGGSAGLNKLAAAGDPKQAKMQEDIQRAIERAFPAQKTYERIEGVVALLLALLLLIAGIGLLSMQPWARWLSLLYAGLDILNVIVSLVIMWVYMIPAMREAMRAIPGLPPEAAKVGETVGTTVAGLAPCAGLIYPIAVLIVMFLPGVTAAFRAPDMAYPPEDREQMEDEYDRGRREREGGDGGEARWND
jgi:hypothetical protein